jgi:branched-chain amino acid aminotransferase
LFLNTRDRVACAGSGNLFLLNDRTLVTPPLEEGVMPGVIRAVVMRLASDVGLSVREWPMSLTDVTDADAVFISSSLKLIAPVKAVGAHPISTRSGHAVARLASAICADIARTCLVDPSSYLRPERCA